MSIQIEMPEWLAQNKDGEFRLHNKTPRREMIYWWSDQSLPVKVYGFDGDWKDSLHRFVNGKWEKV
jgi:hypothetical protein